LPADIKNDARTSIPAGKLSSLIIHYPLVQSSIVTTILIICGETRRRNLPVTTIVLVKISDDGLSLSREHQEMFQVGGVESVIASHAYYVYL
jgi:hypothetical protein